VLNLKVYKEIRENGGWDNYSMVEVEKYPCKDENEARSRERYWYENLNSQLNMIFPQRNLSEWYQANKEEKHQYYDDNKVKILIQAKERYENNREAKMAYRKNYCDENREKIAAKKKIYREKNLGIIKARDSKEFLCGCGRTICVGAKNLHSKSQVHIKHLESNNHCNIISFTNI
jgi:hypothetical protein